MFEGGCNLLSLVMVLYNTPESHSADLIPLKKNYMLTFYHLWHLALGLPLLARCLLLLHCHGRKLISSAGVGEDIHPFLPAF